ncbi:MAG TPA: xanthine dehydrogenase family protein subunit M [Chloroflexota bacterium]|jgi:carbon-monoxide dehydrogenase medium subunit
MTIKRLDLLQPTTLDEACQLYQAHVDDVSYIAGGTALLIMLRERVYQPGYLIDLKTVPGLDGIRHEPSVGLRLGALATHRDVELSPVVRERLPVLAETYRQVGNVRVRHAATVGGNLAHGDYRLDPPAPLIALHASARIVGPDGERTVPLEEFFFGLYATALEPAEVLAEVIVPDPAPRTHTAYLKFTSLSAMDWPCLGVAAAATLAEDGTFEDLRLVYTSVSSAPLLIQGAADAARGKQAADPAALGPLADALGQLAAEQVDPTPDIRGSEWYKGEMARVFAGRAIRAALTRDGVLPAN